MGRRKLTNGSIIDADTTDTASVASAARFQKIPGPACFDQLLGDHLPIVLGTNPYTQGLFTSVCMLPQALQGALTLDSGPALG